MHLGDMTVLGAQANAPLCQALLAHEYTYAYGAVDECTGELESLILPHVNTDSRQLLLNKVFERHPD